MDVIRSYIEVEMRLVCCESLRISHQSGQCILPLSCMGISPGVRVLMPAPVHLSASTEAGVLSVSPPGGYLGRSVGVGSPRHQDDRRGPHSADTLQVRIAPSNISHILSETTLGLRRPRSFDRFDKFRQFVEAHQRACKKLMSHTLLLIKEAFLMCWTCCIRIAILLHRDLIK